MNEEQQEFAVDGLILFLDTHRRLLMKGRRLIQLGNCTVVPFRKGEGHCLCGPPLDGGWFVGDPTVVHPSKLHPLVAFHMFAATLIELNHARKSIKGGSNEWWFVYLSGDTAAGIGTQAWRAQDGWQRQRACTSKRHSRA